MEAPCQISVSTDSQSEVCSTSASQSDSSTTLTSQSGSSMATPTDEKIEPLQSYTEQVSRCLRTKCQIKGYILQF